MDKSAVENRIDMAIRFFLYTLIFWLPYSSAIVETCVIVSLILWIVKRTVLCNFADLGSLTIKDKVVRFLKTYKPKPTFLNTPIFCFIAACLLSVAGSAFWEIALRGFLTKTLEWFIIYFLVIEVFTERKHIVIALSAFLFSALATCLDSIVQFHITHRDIFRGRIIVPGDRAVGPFARPNSLGGYLTFVVPLAFSFLFFYKDKRFVRGAVIFFGIALWGAIVSFSRGAWIGISGGIFFVLSIIKSRLMFLSVLFLAVFVICLYSFASPELKQRSRINLQDSYRAVEGRKDLWLDSLTMIKDRPLFGHGLNTYMNVFQEYRRKAVGRHDYGPTYAHNCYIQIAAETGLFGLACFLWIIGRFFKETIKLIKGHHILEMINMKIILLGLSAGGLAFLVQSFFDTNFYSLQLSALFWFMIGMAASLFNQLNRSGFCGTKRP